MRVSDLLFCEYCGDEISRDFADHFRLFHPDTDVDKTADVLAWPDGETVVIDNTDFGGQGL